MYRFFQAPVILRVVHNQVKVLKIEYLQLFYYEQLVDGPNRNNLRNVAESERQVVLFDHVQYRAGWWSAAFHPVTALVFPSRIENVSPHSKCRDALDMSHPRQVPLTDRTRSCQCKWQIPGLERLNSE